MKVLGEVILYIFLLWKAMMDVNTRLLKIHRNWDNDSSRNPFLSGGFFYSELPLVNLNSFYLRTLTYYEHPPLMVAAAQAWKKTAGH